MRKNQHTWEENTGGEKRRASLEILTLGLRECKECRLSKRGARGCWLRAPKWERGTKVWEFLCRCIIGVCVCWRYRGKIFKGCARVLACVGVDARRC